ncbi:MAG: AI-2E family transporter [Bacteroidales bacterium]|nr:AI-2E family transporter [Bacteroidales bacterium]
MSSTKNFITIILILGILVFLGWYFWDILVYMLIALALSFLGKPLMNLLSRIKIKNWQFPTSLAAVITILVILTVVFLIGFFLIPVAINELSALTNIDTTSIGNEFESWLNKLDPTLRKFGFLNDNEHFSNLITSQLAEEMSKFSMSKLVDNTFSIVSGAFIGTFSVLFMTFFSLKDHGIFFRMIREWIPIRYRNNFSNILNTTGKQLSSYFIGVFVDMICVGLIEFILCLILGIPDAFLIGLIGGLLNIIPFVGPILACIAGIVISLVSLIPASPAASVLMSTMIKVIAIFCVTKMVDDFVLQPTIYGKRTHTHPLEIFIVILMAGHIGGVLAMIFAVPAYTLIRTVVKEFFGAYFSNDEQLPAEE